MALPKRTLGTLEVTAIGVGCMNLSHAYGYRPPEAQAARLLNRALDLGCTFLDTAALYGDGENERLIGRAVGHRRGEFVLASKCVLMMADDGGRTLDGSPDAIMKTLEKSLKSLRTDHIDLYQLHRPDPRVPIEDMVGALVRAKEAGKIGHIGLSEMSAETIRRAHAVHPVTSVQTEYSPMVRNPEIAVLDTCRELGIGFIAFSPVSRGLLADRVKEPVRDENDIRTMFPRFTDPYFTDNRPMIEEFNAFARQRLGIAPAQLSLAWVLAQGKDVVAIPGTTNIDHLEENLAAADIALDAGAIAEVERICDRHRISGPRYNKAAQSGVGTETWPDEILA